MKVTSTPHSIRWRLMKLLVFGIEHENIDGTIDTKAVVVGVAAFFCTTFILILIFL
jgi:hypothetical protein